jgi:hypothetical protein
LPIALAIFPGAFVPMKRHRQFDLLDGPLPAIQGTCTQIWTVPHGIWTMPHMRALKPVA